MTSRHHIAPRIFMRLLALMLAVFACISLSFNLYFRNYIAQTVREQLAEAQDDVRRVPGKERGEGEPAPMPEGMHRLLPNLSKLVRNNLHTEVRIFNTDADYRVTDVDSRDSDTTATAQTLAAALRDRGMSLTATDHVRLTVDGRDYFVTAIDDPHLDAVYMVLYVDVTDVGTLLAGINTTLAVIVACALLICLFVANAIAGTVTTPLRQLAQFAEELGGGSFAPREFHFQDVEFEQLAHTMNRAAERLDAYDKDQKTFFQNVSHELRTPLMAIRCYAEGIACGVMEPRSSVQVLLAETERLSGMVDDLLFLSRMDSPAWTVEKQRGDVCETVARAAEPLQTVAQAQGLHFEYEFDDEPVLLCCHEDDLERAVTNLLTNALRYAHTRITLRVQRVPDGVTIAVADDGDGIAPEALPHVFDRFYKGADGKNGIGLAIVKAATERQGGTACVRVDGETVFTLHFPPDED